MHYIYFYVQPLLTSLDSPFPHFQIQIVFHILVHITFQTCLSIAVISTSLLIQFLHTPRFFSNKLTWSTHPETLNPGKSYKQVWKIHLQEKNKIKLKELKNKNLIWSLTDNPIYS